eukprot:COSAG06_NODE_809_length_12164_cov_17.936179_13_plen_79_part_00
MVVVVVVVVVVLLLLLVAVVLLLVLQSRTHSRGALAASSPLTAAYLFPCLVADWRPVGKRIARWQLLQPEPRHWQGRP